MPPSLSERTRCSPAWSRPAKVAPHTAPQRRSCSAHTSTTGHTRAAACRHRPPVGDTPRRDDAVRRWSARVGAGRESAALGSGSKQCRSPLLARRRPNFGSLAPPAPMTQHGVTWCSGGAGGSNESALRAASATGGGRVHFADSWEQAARLPPKGHELTSHEPRAD